MDGSLSPAYHRKTTAWLTMRRVQVSREKQAGPQIQSMTNHSPCLFTSPPSLSPPVSFCDALFFATRFLGECTWKKTVGFIYKGFESMLNSTNDFLSYRLFFLSSFHPSSSRLPPFSIQSSLFLPFTTRLVQVSRISMRTHLENLKTALPNSRHARVLETQPWPGS